MARADPGKLSAIARRMLAWYDQHRRDLPWRRTRDPYAVWLSEIMLQQTQVATVIPYYERFLRRFPTVRALAKAPIGEVLKLWAGLGYYTRARNLHRAAKIVTDDLNGEFPGTVVGLRALPGIGLYTAGAIASIAYGARAAVVDGNVTRVLSRLVDLSADVGDRKAQAGIWQLAESLLPARRCGDFNQALMELGATVCTPGSTARCGECPVARWCMARRAGTVADRPIKGKKTKVQRETHVVAAIQCGERYLFVRRPDEGLWGGLWELPSAVASGRSIESAARSLSREATAARARGQRFCDFEHMLSHRRIRMIGYEFAAPAGAACALRGAYRWVALREARALGLSRAMQRVVDSLEEQDRQRPRRRPLQKPSRPCRSGR